MNTEQLRRYLDIRLDRIELQLNILTNFMMTKYSQEFPAMMSDLQKKLNDTRLMDFDQFLKGQKKKVGKNRDEVYEEFFECYKQKKSEQ